MSNKRPKPKHFPCPYCRGQGTWVEPVTDEGQGPRYECGGCDGQGIIEIDGPIHQRIKDAKNAPEEPLTTGQQD